MAYFGDIFFANLGVGVVRIAFIMLISTSVLSYQQQPLDLPSPLSVEVDPAIF